MNPLEALGAFAVEVWLFPSNTGPAEQRFLHLQDTEGARVLIETRLDGKGGWVLDTFLRSGENALTLIDRQRVHATDRWYWVALRYDGKTMSAFVNGEKEGEGEVAFGPMGDGRTSIGVRQNKVYWFKGAIREVRFSPSALAEGDLQQVK